MIVGLFADSIMNPGAAAVLVARSGRADFQVFEVFAFRKCNGLNSVETLGRQRIAPSCLQVENTLYIYNHKIKKKESVFRGVCVGNFPCGKGNQARKFSIMP